MRIIHFTKSLNIKPIVGLILLASGLLFGQHRGDNLSYQGTYAANPAGVKASAMGGAYSAQTGDLQSLFYNPAGLADIKKIQFSFAGNYNSELWREHQQWRPDRLFVTLPFYLTGLAPLDPKFDGQLDTARVRDPNYIVSDPKLGMDPYSKEAADWEKTKNKFTLGYVAAAIPFSVLDYRFGFAASFNRQNISDYDRNDTYLNPFLGYFGYGDIQQVNGKDTLVVSWSKFYRDRTGYINNIPLALGCEVIENLKVGVGVNIAFGTTTDFQRLERIGDFTLIDVQKFKFSHILNNIETNGESKFSSIKINAGVVYSFDNVNVAFKVDLPYTLERKWNYTTVIKTASSSVTKNEEGTDKLKIPAAFTFGVSFNPVKAVIIAFDYANAPYGGAEFTLSKTDPTYHNLVNSNSYRFGIEYKAAKWISLLAGYSNTPETFIPDGAADKERGPAWDAYSGGVSLNMAFGRIDLAYGWKQLKYYDSYFSNSNYQMQISNNITLGYSYSF